MRNRPKVFGIGLSKTGTMSLAEALRLLGYRALHLRHEDGRVVMPWEMDDYDALTDISATGHFKRFERRYPDSRFIYTVRELNAWLKSIYCEFFWARPEEEAGLPGVIGDDGRLKMVARFSYGSLGKQTFDRRWWIQRYVNHDTRVFRFFGPRPELKQRLLVLDICGGEGWEKLCPFLDCEIPEISFPHVHRSVWEDVERLPEGLLT